MPMVLFSSAIRSRVRPCRAEECPQWSLGPLDLCDRMLQAAPTPPGPGRYNEGRYDGGAGWGVARAVQG
jgi:hypothetical protein